MYYWIYRVKERNRGCLRLHMCCRQTEQRKPHERTKEVVAVDATKEVFRHIMQPGVGEHMFGGGRTGGIP